MMVFYFEGSRGRRAEMPDSNDSSDLSSSRDFRQIKLQMLSFLSPNNLFSSHFPSFWVIVSFFFLLILPNPTTSFLSPSLPFSLLLKYLNPPNSALSHRFTHCSMPNPSICRHLLLLQFMCPPLDFKSIMNRILSCT